MRRAAAAAVVVLLAVAGVGCTGSSDGGSSKDKPDPAVDKAWAAARKDPCSLLSSADVTEALPGSKPELLEGPPPGSCRYQLTDDRQLEIDLYRPLTAAALTRRTSGTDPLGKDGSDGAALRLDTPGAGVIVHEGGAAALVAVRTTGAVGAELPDEVAALADAVHANLPEPAAPGTKLADRDLCDVVGPQVLGTGFTAGDGRDPDTCAYRNADGALFTVRLRDGTTTPSGLAVPWKPGGKGATWQASGAKAGGSGLALIPVEAGTVEVTISSPAQSDEDLEAIAAEVAALIRAADREK